MRRPNLPQIDPSGIFRALGDWLRRFRYALGDILYVLGRFPRAVGRGVARAWTSLPFVLRRRLAAAVVVVATAALFAVLIVPNLPCQFPGGDQCAPDDDAIELAPAGAVAYVHANLDPETEQFELASDLAERTPEVSPAATELLLPLLLAGTAAPSDFNDQIRPWFGGEIATVVLPSGADDQRVQLLEADDGEGALAYAESIATGDVETAEHEGVEVRSDGAGLASALVDDFLVLGDPDAVRAVIDVARGVGEAQPLAEDEIVERAFDELPDQRFAKTYLSGEGVGSLAGSAEGALAPLEPLLDSGATRGAAISLSAADDGFELASRSVLDPERVESDPGFFSAFSGFDPELPGELAPDTFLYLGLGDPGATVDELLGQATVRAPGIAAGFTDLVDRLRAAADIDLEQDLLTAISGEGAFAVVPRGETEGAPEPQAEGLPGGETPETVSPGGAATPFLQFLADGVDEERAREAMARLQAPIAEAIDPALGNARFEPQRFGDIEAQVLQFPSAAVLAYAAFDSKLAIANDTAAIERLATGAESESLGATDAYEEAVDGLPSEPSLIAYADLAGLLDFVEASGLRDDPAFAAFAPDLRVLRTLALTVLTEDDVLAADARLLVGE